MSSRDYEEFLESFNAHGVRYLVVGAHAVAFHARPRATKDLDLYLEPTLENAEPALAAIRDFFEGGYRQGSGPRRRPEPAKSAGSPRSSALIG